MNSLVFTTEGYTGQSVRRLVNSPNRQRKMPRPAGSVGRFRRATRLLQELKSSFLKPKIRSILLPVGALSAFKDAFF